jgi:hypothetical protein
VGTLIPQVMQEYLLECTLLCTFQMLNEALFIVDQLIMGDTVLVQAFVEC